MTVLDTYVEEGKSGKSIEGRTEFQRMLDDIQSRKVHTDYVLVFKLSRFGRNARDVLNSLEFIMKYSRLLLARNILSDDGVILSPSGTKKWRICEKSQTKFSEKQIFGIKLSFVEVRNPFKLSLQRGINWGKVMNIFCSIQRTANTDSQSK